MTDPNPQPIDGDDALDPAAMLKLIKHQQDDIQKRTAKAVPWILLAWGVAWGVGFSLLWLIDGARPAFSVPVELAGSVFALLMVIALAISAILGVRTGRGIRSSPGAAFTGAVYGMTWSVGFIALFAFGSALIRNGMDPGLANIFYPTGSVLFVGIMYIIAGAIWRAVPAVVMGGWIVLVAMVAPYFGYPVHYLIFAIAGGGAFVVGAVVTAFYTRAIQLKGLS